RRCAACWRTDFAPGIAASSSLTRHSSQAAPVLAGMGQAVGLVIPPPEVCMSRVRSALALAVGLAFASPAPAWDQASLDAAPHARLQGDRTGAGAAVAVIGQEQVLRSRACADPGQLARIADDP